LQREMTAFMREVALKAKRDKPETIVLLAILKN
jgi:hypothetical protein